MSSKSVLKNMRMRPGIVLPKLAILLVLMFANLVSPAQAIRSPNFAQHFKAPHTDQSTAQTVQNVFRVELLHRDHPSSPLHTSASKTERIARSVKRSKDYFHNAAHRKLRRVLDMSDGEYVMNLKLGTPPQSFAAVMSTVESVVWMQCLPCGQLDDHGCYEQLGPKFDPQQSATFQKISCTSPACPSFGDEVEGPDWNTCGKSNQCLYDYDWAGDEAPYGEDAASLGDFVLDSLTLESIIGIPRFAFGCSHDYYDLSGMNGSGNPHASGFAGLGPGSLSLPSQLNQTVHDRFSYCLLGTEASSNLTTSVLFGDVTPLPDVVYTPIINKENWYDVGLTGITINGRKLSIPSNSFSNGVAFDARIALSVFGDEAYQIIRKTVHEAMQSYEETSRDEMDLCYNLTGVSNPILPSAVLHFAGSANYSCSSENLFMYMDESETILCLAMLSRDTYTDSGFSSYNIIGNVMQQNHQLIFDRRQSRLGFTSTNCATI